ncbi:MAG: glycosyltransferase family 4 protein [Methanobacteriota archaeon]
MRILFLALDVDLARQRGDTVHTTELAAAFARLGHEVALVVGANAASGPPDSGIRVHDAAGSNVAVLRRLRAIRRGFPFDVVYERRTSPKIGFALRVAADIPVVLEVNGILRDELGFQGRPQARPVDGRLRTAARGAMFRRVDAFVAVGKAIREDLVASYRVDPSRVHVIGNGVNVERFRPMPKAGACRALGLEASAPRIAFAGNLVPWRDLDALLDAFVDVRARLPDAHLQLLGDGQDRERLARRATAEFRGAVTLVGEVPYASVPDYLNAADVCALPEKLRTLDVSPLKLYEYLACARPVVAFDVPGLGWIERAGVGRLARPGDARDLGRAILELLADPAARSEAGAKGRAYVEREASWSRVARDVVGILESTLGRAG